jgi:stage II sporulation SpoAA-like protein
MLSHELERDEGILVVKPEGPLSADDFTTLASHVDAYLEQNGTLNGVLVIAKKFPGWKDFGALIAHLKFVRHHHQKIEKVAVVADGSFAKVMPHVASHFVHAQVKHFDDEDAAREWLGESSRAHVRSAA